MVFTPEYILAVETALHTVRERCENAIEGHLLLSLDKAASTSDTLVFAATAQSWMTNIGGALHGGMAALLLDEVMGCAANSMKVGEAIAPTVQMQLNYHRPVPVDTPLTIFVSCVSRTRHLIHLSARICLAGEDIPLVSTTATFYNK